MNQTRRPREESALALLKGTVMMMRQASASLVFAAAALRAMSCAILPAAGVAVVLPSSASATPPGPGALPTASTASPDVLGIKLGASTVDEVRKILGAHTPPLAVDEESSELMGRAQSGRAYAQSVRVPNGQYVSKIQAMTASFRHRFPDCNQGNIGRLGLGDCEGIIVEFSGPPDAGIALSVRRFISFADSPSDETTERGLIAKYGEPSFRTSSGQRSTQRQYYWAWDAGGKLMQLDARHLCATPTGTSLISNLNGREGNAKNVLEAGCAATVLASMNIENGAVRNLLMQAIDHFRMYTTMGKTREFIAAAVSDFERGERDKASQVEAPKF